MSSTAVDGCHGPFGARACKVPIVFQMIIRARAGLDRRRPYCFSKDYLLGPEQGSCEVPIIFKWLLGPEQGTCKVPIVFVVILFIIRAWAGLDLRDPYYFSKDFFFLCPKWLHLSQPEHTPKLTKLGI